MVYFLIVKLSLFIDFWVKKYTEQKRYLKFKTPHWNLGVSKYHSNTEIRSLLSYKARLILWGR